MVAKKLGRPRNSVKYAAEIATLNDAIAAHVMEIFEKGMELVRGVEVSRGVDDDGDDIIYSRPPDPKMICYFLDRLAGKPVQAVEFEGDEGRPPVLDLRLLPDDDLVALERIIKRLSLGGPSGTAERN